MDDTSHAQIKSEIDRIVKNIDTILKKVENLDPNGADNTGSGENGTK